MTRQKTKKIATRKPTKRTVATTVKRKPTRSVSSAKKKTIKQKINHGVKMAVVPHKKNDYKPHLIRGYGLFAIALVVIGVQLGYNVATTGNVLGHQSDITITSLVNQTNDARVSNGEHELQLNDKLTKAAYMKAQDMFDNQYWAHDSPSGVEPWKWFGDAGYKYSEAGENLAKNFTTTGAVMTAWLASPEHRANILKNDYKDVGFAIVKGDLKGQDTILIVAFYGLPASDAVAGIQTSLIEADPSGTVNILAQFGSAIQSITPAALGGLMLLAAATIVAAITHAFRRKLPTSFKRSWYRHHGIYKAVGLMAFGIVVIFLYGGGQI
ncbi:MAG TPA: CAP domain-containing protein [Candidatus Saccharibacteria bacterium]|nr:CAP domain-containing protein [Candidatus Saccharibacteria bacterium]